MQTTQVCSPLGLKREEVVERGDAVDPAGRQLQAVGDVEEQVGLQVAEQLLGRVQHLDQRVGLELVPLHRRFEHLEAVVAAGVRPGPLCSGAVACATLGTPPSIRAA